MALADQIRKLAQSKYVLPAIRSGRQEFSIAVRDLMADAKREGIATVQRTPPFCTSIQTREFLTENGLEVSRVDGPAKKLSTTVVVHYRVAGSKAEEPPPKPPASETPEQRAVRLAEKIRGLMKDEIAAYGGGEAYLRWVRGEDQDDEA